MVLSTSSLCYVPHRQTQSSDSLTPIPGIKQVIDVSQNLASSHSANKYLYEFVLIRAKCPTELPGTFAPRGSQRRIQRFPHHLDHVVVRNLHTLIISISVMLIILHNLFELFLFNG